MSPHDIPPFDPREPSSPPSPLGHRPIIERFVYSMTADTSYRILFGELFKHILLPPLLLTSIVLHAVSAYLGPPQDFSARAEHFFIQCMSLALILFAFFAVVVTLLDAMGEIEQNSAVLQYLRTHSSNVLRSLVRRLFSSRGPRDAAPRLPPRSQCRRAIQRLTDRESTPGNRMLAPSHQQSIMADASQAEVATT